MTIDKNIYTTNFVNWVKEMNSEDEGCAILRKLAFVEVLVLYERSTGKSPKIRK